MLSPKILSVITKINLILKTGTAKIVTNTCPSLIAFLMITKAELANFLKFAMKISSYKIFSTKF